MIRFLYSTIVFLLLALGSLKAQDNSCVVAELSVELLADVDGGFKRLLDADDNYLKGWVTLFELGQTGNGTNLEVVRELGDHFKNNPTKTSKTLAREIEEAGGYEAWATRNLADIKSIDEIVASVEPEYQAALRSFLESSEEAAEAFGRNPDLVDTWKKLDDLGETALKTDVDWLKRVDDWDGAGVQLSKNGDNLKLSDGSGNALGEFKNGELIPETGKYANTGTPKGDVVNGYQVVDNGGQLGIKRVPDKSSYNASELTELTQHPNAHVLERHGHDVPDEALIKRANEGIAPDGSNIGNPSSPVKPPYSSKFETPDQLKLALDNTRPGTPAFNAAPTKNGTKVVIHELTGGASYGKGVPRDGNIFETSTKVRAVYREVSPGNFQLLTMFPDF